MVTVTTWISFIGGHVEVITDKQWQYYILETSHAGVQAEDVEDTARNTGGHLGINKTCKKITSCFYWPGIKSDVIDYIKGCERCQRVNRSALQKSSLELYNVPIPMKVMSQVGIDLMKLCETDGFEHEAGFQYVITAQCYFMKYVEIGALRTKTGPEVANWIYMNIFCHYGVTDIHITDRGNEFCNIMFKELYKKCGVRHCIMMPYHPQANGMIERCNCTTSEMILKMISTERKQKDWVNYLPTVAFALHSSMHHITNYEPLRLLIGCKPKLPSECTQYEEDVLKNLDFTEEEIELLSQTVTQENFHSLVEMRDSVFANAHANIKKGQKRQKKNYDLRNERPV